MKTKKLKTALSLLLVGVLAFQLAGCAGIPGKPDDPGGAPGTTTLMGEPEKPADPNSVTGDKTVNLMAAITPGSAEAVPISPEAAAAAADFALRLFRAGNDPEQNTLISPLSVLSALAMTANGAENATLTQMESTLGLRRELLNEFIRSYMDVLAGDDTLKLANSVWFTSDSRFMVNREFLQTNADFYGADVYQAPFDGSTLEDLNNWVKEKTDGMIPKILDEIPPAALMYLVNALAFNAKWASPYPSESVSSGNFRLENGENRLADFMYSEEHEYLEDEKATGFLKRYAGGKYAFVALLPREGIRLEDYVNSLDGAALQKLLSEASAETVYTSLPKFETAYGTELSGVLASMGMKLPFDAENADFSGLGTSTGGNIFISRVIHKTFISVTEEGTRAGAATVVEMADGAVLIENPKQVYLDRPFVYLLVDTENNLPLFIGTLLDPKEPAQN